jgi:hypothetical protein
MKLKYILAALPLVLPLAMSAAAQARMRDGSAPPPAYRTEGHEVAAPPWSAACMTDHGPSQCGEPMWVYDSPAVVERYRKNQP